MRIPVAHNVCAVMTFSLRFNNTPPPTSAIPAKNPIATRSSGGIRLCSNEYFTKKATPRNKANPPIQANIFAPMNCSQSILRDGGGVVRSEEHTSELQS